MTHLLSYLKSTKTRQADFADKVGVTQATISKIACGDLTPSLEVAAAIEAATDGKVLAVSLIARKAAPRNMADNPAATLRKRGRGK